MSLSVEEAAKIIGVPPFMLSSWVWSGAGPKTEGGRRFSNVLFDPKELQRWLGEKRGDMNAVIGPDDPVWPEPPKDRAPRNLQPKSELRRTWQSQPKT